jgi:hypothetical protein
MLQFSLSFDMLQKNMDYDSFMAKVATDRLMRKLLMLHTRKDSQVLLNVWACSAIDLILKLITALGD